MKSSYFKLLSIIIISCLGIIVYSNTFHSSFHFDDSRSIGDNLFIKNIYNLQNIWNFLPRRFFLYLSIAFNYHFNGLNVFGYHLFNLIIHLVSAIFVYWLTLLTLSTPAMKENKITQHSNFIALFTGLVFVSHPIQTEAVTYIVQRTASMATLFYLASLSLYVKSRLLQDKKISSGPWKFYYIGSLITTIMAMFTKETTITLPLMILFYEFSFLKIKKGLNWGYLSPFLLTILIIPITMYTTESVKALQTRGVVPEEPTGISCLHYLLTQFRVMVTYIRLVFLPFHQNLDYDYPIFKNIFELPVLFSFLFLITILFWAKCLFSKYRLVSFSIFWFFLTLLPESSILPIKDVIVEHRLYLPLVGFSMFLVSGGYSILEKGAFKAMVVALTMITACNSVLTYQRNKVWKDEITLWDDVVGKSPNKARPFYNLGTSWLKAGNFTKAMSDFNRAIEINPHYAEAYNNRGLIYSKQGNLAQAMSDFNKAIEIDPNYAEGYNNRGGVYSREGNSPQALSDYNKAIEITPKYVDAYINRGILYDKQGNFAEALSDYSRAVEIDPGLAEIYNNRGVIYYKQGNYAQALSDYNKAIEIDSKFAEVYNNRGNVYGGQGDLTRAMFDFDKAIEINVNDSEAYNNRGHIYINEGNVIQAIRDFTKAIEINPKYVDAYNNRAVGYYALNEYDMAWADVHKAEELGAVVNPNFLNDLKHASY